MIKKYYLILITSVLCLLISCLDPYFDKSIKVYGDIYLLQSSGTAGFSLTYQTSENYHTSIISPEVLEVIKREDKIFVKQQSIDSVVYFQVNVNDKYIRNSLKTISALVYENNKAAKDSKVMFMKKE